MFKLWSEPLYLGIVFITCFSLLSLMIVYYVLQKNRPHLRSSWASVVSWLFLAPFLFLMLGMDWPIPLALITLIAIYGAKVFFQMTGLYHRSYFVLTGYAGIICCGATIYLNESKIFDLMPAVFFLTICLIPMVRNSYKHMVQYMALSMVNFILLWAFMHLGWILKMSHGVYITIYIILLTEVFENVYLGVSRRFKKIKIVSELNPKRSLEGYTAGAIITLAVAYGLKDVLPFPHLWWLIGCACFIFGSTGDTVLVVIRRDLGIKVYGSFVVGRGDFFTRIERLVFVAPACYYAILYWQGSP